MQKLNLNLLLMNMVIKGDVIMKKLVWTKHVTLMSVIICMSTVFTTKAAAYSGGSGSEGDPYQIATAADLIDLSTNLVNWTNHFVQTANVDLDSVSFSPIGTGLATPFVGIYNGGGYTISNLYINRPDENFVGLFGYVTVGASISDCHVRGGEITGKDLTGGFVGYIKYASSISNSSSTATVNGGQFTGGFVGQEGGGTLASDNDLLKPHIVFCYASGNVTSNSKNVGGFVGWQTGIINGCYALGNVHSTHSTYGRVGGFAGTVAYLDKSTGKISDCYAKGNVTSAGNNSESSGLGGFVGYLATGEIRNCYSIGTVDEAGSDFGGFAGLTNSPLVCANNFWDTETSGLTSSSGGTGKTTAKMKTESTFTGAGWDFINETVNGSVDIWALAASVNDGYPSFIWTGDYPFLLPKQGTEFFSR